MLVGSAIRTKYTHRSKREYAVVTSTCWLARPLMIATFLGMQVLPLLYVFSPWLSFADHQIPSAVGWVGTVMFSSALWLLWRAHAGLGDNWLPVAGLKSDHNLITSGVYTRIRHPMYAAHFLWAIAQGLLLGNWLAGWSMLVFFIPLYCIRVKREEELMLQQFGGEYADYMSRSGRLFPLLK